MGQKSRFIFAIYVVDMMIDPKSNEAEKTEAGVDKEPDVIAVVQLCAADPNDAAKKTFAQLGAEKLISEGRRYHVHCILIGPLPQTGGNIIAATGAEAAAILKDPRQYMPANLRAGEIVARPDH